MILFETLNVKVDTKIKLKLEYIAIKFIRYSEKNKKSYFKFNINYKFYLQFL